MSLVEAEAGIFEVIATGGSTDIGGINMDEEVESWLISEYKKQNFDTLDGQLLTQVKSLAKRLKESLSEKETVSYEEILTFKESTKFSGNITRGMFEDLIGHIITESQMTIKQVLKDAEITPSEIDKVILVGGPTKIPAIQKMITQTVKEPEKGVDPDFAVSIGAAIEGAILANESNLPVPYQGLTLLNVTPLDLGEEAREKGQHKIILMIPKNTPYPTEYTRTFFVNKIMQTEVRVSIWQGDFEIDSGFIGNVNIGTFTLHGLRQGIQNKIEVTYGIDDDGILTVKAWEVGTDTVQELVVDKVWTNFGTPPQLEYAKKEMEDFEKKYYDTLSPYEIPIDVSNTKESQKIDWMCKCLSEAKNILKTHHNNFDPAFFDTARFELFLQMDMQYAFAYIQLTGGPVYPIGIHKVFKEKTRENQRSLIITLVHELLHAIHPHWGHNRINPEERRLANLAGYFDTYRENEIKFQSGQMSFCNNTMTDRDKRIRILCND